MKITVADRYAAFLVTYLPQFGAVATAGLGESAGPRIRPLEVAHSYAAGQPGISLEFGVFRGASINFIAKNFPSRQYYGFDSFEGFPDDGRSDWNQDFSTQGQLPSVPDNVKLIKGFFSDTLPDFLDDHMKDSIKIINIDCDIYSSTKDIFNLMTERKLITPGIIISFDELINYDGYLWNEMFAFFEMLEENQLGFKCIAIHKNIRTIEETILLKQSNSHPKWEADIASGFRQQASVILTKEPLNMSALRTKYLKNKVKQVSEFLTSTQASAPKEILSTLKSEVSMNS